MKSLHLIKLLFHVQFKILIFTIRNTKLHLIKELKITKNIYSATVVFEKKHSLTRKSTKMSQLQRKNPPRHKQNDTYST